MLRFWLVVGVVGGCGSENTCDQRVAASIANLCWNLRGPVPGNMDFHISAPFTCDGGGSGSMDVQGNTLWAGTYMFDGCTMSAVPDRVGPAEGTLTLTGTLMFRGDDINDADYGMSTTLTISGALRSCDGPIDETCAVSWSGVQGSYNGALCGRQFP